MTTERKRGGLSDDPEVRKRQVEGLERGRAIAAERRRAGLPSKRKERELEARVIEGGARGEKTERDEGSSSRGSTEEPKPKTRRKAVERREPDPVETDRGGLPWFAPLYTGRRNDRFIEELDAADDDG